jgi:hypothetical protein
LPLGDCHWEIAAGRICWEIAAGRICWENLLGESAGRICWENLLGDCHWENLQKRIYYALRMLRLSVILWGSAMVLAINKGDSKNGVQT